MHRIHGPLSQRRRRLLSLDLEGDDPLSGMANLFDTAMVFAVALMAALVSYFGVQELLGNQDVTMVKNPGQSNMEIIVKKGKKVKKYRMNDQVGGGRKGKKLGTAYMLENGEVVYVPEGVENGEGKP